MRKVWKHSLLVLVLIVVPTIMSALSYQSERKSVCVVTFDLDDVDVMASYSRLIRELDKDSFSSFRIDDDTFFKKPIVADAVVIIGHGCEKGIIDNETEITSWTVLYEKLSKSTFELKIVLACGSSSIPELQIFGYPGVIDGEAGAILSAWKIETVLIDKTAPLPVDEIIAAQKNMHHPLPRYLYFIHGYFGANSEFENMRSEFISDGVFTEFTDIKYFSYYDAYGVSPGDSLALNALHYTPGITISSYANNLATELLSYPADTHITIIGHSMGGIITREMLALKRSDLDCASIYIDRVITLGTPHLGTWLANPLNNWAVILTTIMGLVPNAQLWPSPIFYQMVPTSLLLYNLNSDPMSYSSGIQWYTGAGIDPIPSAALYWIHGAPSDPIVATNRAHLSFSIVSNDYDGIGHGPLVSSTSSSGTFNDVTAWALAGADDDQDGLTNDAELYCWGSSPTDQDSDDDGLLDGDEVELHGTSPIHPNSDGDAINDGTEVSWGYDPLDSNSPIPASSLIYSAKHIGGSKGQVYTRHYSAMDYVKVYVKYQSGSGSWTGYSYVATDYTPNSGGKYLVTWYNIPTWAVKMRVLVKAYNSGSLYLGCDSQIATISGGGGGPPPPPID